MSVTTMSILLYTALQTMQPCEKVFVDTAKATNPAFKIEEQSYLEEFSKAACATSNPDILWLIALQETSFRFRIIRENNGESPSILEGPSATAYLKKLKRLSKGKNPPTKNVDIGVMQFNWHWHGNGFSDDPMLALSPKRQVNYFVEKYSREIFKTCEKSWVGCYHNQTNKKLTKKYQRDITKKTTELANNSLTFIRDARLKLTGEELDALPPAATPEFYKTVSNAKRFPVPVKNEILGNVADASAH